MNSGVSPASITAAALTTQVLLLGVILVGAFLQRSGQPEGPVYKGGLLGAGSDAWLFAFFCLFTVCLLVFSDQFANFWSPLFGDTHFYVVRWSHALLLVVLLDILFVCGLVQRTGGSPGSPFTPLYFILPPLAIFLRESGGRVLLYTCLSASLFTFNMFAQNDEDTPRGAFAYWFVSVASFCLATLIGYITRPR